MILPGRFLPGLLVCGAALLGGFWHSPGAGARRPEGVDHWTDSELSVLRSLSLESLPPPPPDPSNRVADDPGAARLGERVFFDTRFSADGRVACATCHQPTYGFTDALPHARGLGEVRRRSMPLLGMAYQDWFFWDGRKDSSWAQALAPLEDPNEHGISRTLSAALVFTYYREEYAAVFGPLPKLDAATLPPLARPSADNGETDHAWLLLAEPQRTAINTVYVNLGKALAAYVRSIVPTAARFDHYVAALGRRDRERFSVLDPAEVRGLRLFIGRARCVDCHNGPLLTNGTFHPTGSPAGLHEDTGRAEAFAQLASDPFGCLGEHSDADPMKDCGHVRFMDDDAVKYRGAFKTPTLRNVAERPPYLHQGQLGTLLGVLENYCAVAADRSLGLHHSDLTDAEIDDLVAFLRALSSPLRLQ